jgi:uncharacterized membrane protein YedE/YeeE
MAQHSLSEFNDELKTAVGLSTAAYVRVLLLGTLFGIVLIKSEVVRWQRIHDMFLFKEPHMYLIIGTAVVIGAISMWLIRRFEIKTIDSEPIEHKPKPYNKGVILGGTIFGMGWAITGACPGPIYAQIGAGEWVAVLTFIGALGGMYLYGYLRPRLPH